LGFLEFGENFQILSMFSEFAVKKWNFPVPHSVPPKKSPSPHFPPQKPPPYQGKNKYAPWVFQPSPYTNPTHTNQEKKQRKKLAVPWHKKDKHTPNKEKDQHKL